MNQLRSPIVWRLILWFLLLSLVPIGVVLIFVQRDVQSLAVQVRSDDLTAMARLLASRLDSQPSQMQAIIEEFDTAGRTIFLLDSDGRYLAHPDPAKVGQDVRLDFADPEMVAQMLAGSGETIRIEQNQQFFNATRLGSGDRIVVIVEETQALFETLGRLSVQVTFRLFVSFVITSLIAGVAVFLILAPLAKLSAFADQLGGGELGEELDPTEFEGEIADLARSLNNMAERLRQSFSVLEQRVAERTRNLQLASDVSRSVSQLGELDVILRNACELILKEFDLYYVQVYLADPARQILKLQAGTGEVGKTLRARQHQLPLDTSSINGRAAVEKQPVVIPETEKSPTFKPNPLLPDTRSEMAVPLIVGETVVGVLDMQSSQPGALSEQALPAFEALAGQLAIAIQNARLLEETERARAEVEAQARRLVRANWQEYLDALHMPERIGFTFEAGQVMPVNEPEPSVEQADGVLTAPIDLTGEVIGALVVEVDPERQTAQNRELIQAVARQLAQKLEGLRLLESAERYRLEAEEAARRLTREGWEEYLKGKRDESLAYLYDLTEVRPTRPQVVEAEAALTLPLKVREETIGKLAVLDFESAQPEDLELVTAVAERLSEHLERLRLFEETQRGQMELDKRARQLAAVSRISTVSAQELDVQKMLASVVQLTQREFGVYHAHVFTYNELAQHLEIVACGWEEGSEHEGTHGVRTIPIDQEQSLVARAARTRLPVVVNDVHSDPGWLPNPLLPETAAELAVPLVIADQVLGVLDVQSKQINAFSEEDVNIQMTLAAQVATALQNARSFERAQRQAEREALLNAISQKIQSATSVEAVLQIAARELGHALGAARTIAQLSLKDQR